MCNFTGSRTNTTVDGHIQMFQCARVDSVAGGDLSVRWILVFIETVGPTHSTLSRSRATNGFLLGDATDLECYVGRNYTDASSTDGTGVYRIVFDGESNHRWNISGLNLVVNARMKSYFAAFVFLSGIVNDLF